MNHVKNIILNKYKIATNSTLPNIIKTINDILEKKFKSKKFRLFIPYKEDAEVLVSVRNDNLNAFSKSKLSKVKMLDKIKREIINNTNIKKAILESSSSIFTSVLKRFLLKIFIGLTNL